MPEGPSAPVAALLASPALENSVWYGSALISFLVTGEMTDGRYSVQRWHAAGGFAPPAPHRHGPEDFYILRGEVRFWVGEDELLARAGDFVRTVPGGWHTLRFESDEVEMLAVFAPAGLEGFFRELGRPAQAMELPGGRIGPPDPERLRELAPKYGIEFAPPGTTPADIGTLP
jgi:quercetin dioxygenase-like cupin family protein